MRSPRTHDRLVTFRFLAAGSGQSAFLSQSVIRWPKYVGAGTSQAGGSFCLPERRRKRWASSKGCRSPPPVWFIKKTNLEAVIMKLKVNLREIYPFYQTDVWVEVEEEMARELRQFELDENAYILKRYRNRAYFSLNREDGIEQEALYNTASPEELLLHKASREELYKALCQLPDKWVQRIYAHYMLGMSKVAIARSEQIDESTVRKSIERGLHRLARLLKSE
jgi:RNA polymerase sigma-70 factor (ECF subfamily)